MDWFLYDNGFRHERVKYNSASLRLHHKICLLLIPPTVYIDRLYLSAGNINLSSVTERLNYDMEMPR